MINKPTGLSTYGANPGDTGIAEWLELHHGLKVFVCSRLDKGTSGILLFALTPEASGEAERIHEKNLAGKSYYFISDGKHAGKREWSCSEPLDGKACVTGFSEIKSGFGYFLYRAQIRRGRRHQVRRHAALSGVALLGDDKYGGTPFPRLCLHCAELTWPGLEEPIQIDLPPSFQMLLEGEKRILIEAAIAYERRLHWLQTVSEAFRIVHRGELGAYDLSLDLFGSWLLLTGYDEKLSSEQLKVALESVFPFWKERYHFQGGIIRNNRKNPHEKKLFGDLLAFGEKPPAAFFVKEQDLSYEIALNDCQHTGLFLDQRDSRKRVEVVAEGRRIANLFSFTCSFSAVSVDAGAEVVFSVDLASGALERGKKNFDLNGLSKSGRGKFIKEDVLKWLTRQVRKKEGDPVGYKAWDLIICDPPVFAASGKGSAFSVEKAWPLLAEHIRLILSHKGIALMANNHRSGSDKYYRTVLEKEFSRVIPFRPPFDFPELPGHGSHVRIYWCEV
ncbi:MAG: class I SAM-dependent methyltransferase [Deltaproteobacteria bacterium]|nr:class I SAM-dependent methyltransferase [Deltaproteobacteria bacterium]